MKFNLSKTSYLLTFILIIIIILLVSPYFLYKNKDKIYEFKVEEDIIIKKSQEIIENEEKKPILDHKSIKTYYFKDIIKDFRFNESYQEQSLRNIISPISKPFLDIKAPLFNQDKKVSDEEIFNMLYPATVIKNFEEAQDNFINL